MRFWSTLSAVVAGSAIAQAAFPQGYIKRVQNDQLERKAIIEKLSSRSQSFENTRLEKRAHKFLNEKTKKFAVNGTGIPEVFFDVGESYAGLLPISDSPHETRELFFWFFPSTNPAADQEITVWLNGGPGCSSLAGLVSENGPFLWADGTFSPSPNPYAWSNLTNVLWVEQPVGVGFSQGVPDITDEVGVGKQFVGFYKQFVKAFDLKGWKLYITGESYAGYYVPYIADAFISANDPDIKLKGLSINDPILGDENLQQNIVVQPFIEYWDKLFYLNETFRAQLAKDQKECGYSDYLDKYLTFPPPQKKFPTVSTPNDGDKCEFFARGIRAIRKNNPCFNIYHVTDTCPQPLSIFGGAPNDVVVPKHFQPYFKRHDVQRAIHAKVGTDWEQCSDINVFGGKDDNDNEDQSLGPARDGVLQRVIEYTNNVIIGSGNLDYILNANGTLLALQNTTWNGLQGLQRSPDREDFYVPYHPEYNQNILSGGGVVGKWTHERGLTFYQVQLSGHELPGYAPGAGYRHLEYLLGRIHSLSDKDDFTTQKGNFGN